MDLNIAISYIKIIAIREISTYHIYFSLNLNVDKLINI